MGSGSLEDARTALIQYSEALSALAAASSPNEASEANRELTDIVAAMQASGKEIADLVRALLVDDGVTDSD